MATAQTAVRLMTTEIPTDTMRTATTAMRSLVTKVKKKKKTAIDYQAGAGIMPAPA